LNTYSSVSEAAVVIFSVGIKEPVFLFYLSSLFNIIGLLCLSLGIFFNFYRKFYSFSWIFFYSNSSNCNFSDFS